MLRIQRCKGIERGDEQWNGFLRKLAHHVAVLDNQRVQLEEDQNLGLETLDPARVCLTPLQTYVGSANCLRHSLYY
jgi:hypothetical protein